MKKEKKIGADYDSECSMSYGKVWKVSCMARMKGGKEE